MRRAWVMTMLWAAVLLWSAGLPAQTDPGPVPVLHAYATLVQVPVLVLSDQRSRLPVVAAGQFSVSIDSGPFFAPIHVRREGLDPIRLVLLLDASPNTRPMIARLTDAMPDLAASLSAADEVSFALVKGCAVTQTKAVPAVLPSLRRLADAVVAELGRPAPASTAAATPAAKTCGDGPRLWDAALVALNRVEAVNARRVLLLVTDGVDDHSVTTVQQLRLAAGADGVAIFGLWQQRAEAVRRDGFAMNRDAFSDAIPTSREVLSPLVTLTEMSGGVTLGTDGRPLAEGLVRIVGLLRERYVVEFQRPSKAAAGGHSMVVRVDAKHVFVRWAGVGVPLPDPALENDPTRVPNDPGREPPIGTRRMLPR